MQVYAATPVFLALIALCALGGSRGLLLLVAASLPTGMLAVASLPSLGGLSLLAVNVAAAALVATGCGTLMARLVRHEAMRIEPASLALMAFALYALFSATVLVRLFAGHTMVFALARGAVGVKVSALFSWGKVWLAPGSSNISQTFYILLACGFFVAACHALSRHGPTLAAQAMALAGGVNLVLGLMDLASLDAALAPIRTANYSLANEASVSGIARVVGGYSEAASFGAASATFFGWSATAFLRRGRVRDAGLALGNGAFAVLALSSTGIVALAAVVAVLIPAALLRLPARIGRGRLLLGACALAAVALGVGCTLALTRAPDLIGAVLGDLILDKSGSASGLERTAWAMGGLSALADTWGLGAGAGSLRSNGLAFVLLGSVGIPGTAAFAAFLALAFGGPAAPGQADALSCARVAGLAVLVSQALAATVPDPGIALVLLAAIATAARRVPAAQAQPRAAPGLRVAR